MIKTSMLLNRFNAGLSAFMLSSSLANDVILRKTALDLLASILRPPPYGTHPVDTGRARAGWYASMKALGMPTNSLYSRLKSSSQVELGKKEGRYSERLGTTRNKKEIRLVNGVKYILYLEYGWSKQQAPAGMVRVSVQKMLNGFANNLGRSISGNWR